MSCRLSGSAFTSKNAVSPLTPAATTDCLTMRKNTERPVTVDVGTNLLVGDNRARLLAALESVIEGNFKRGRIPELWDGNAAARIVDILEDELSDSGDSEVGAAGIP